MKLLLGLAVCAAAACGQTWVAQKSGTEVSLRGVSVVNARVVWASGTDGTVLRTVDGGATWKAVRVPGAEGLDFRGVRALDERTVLLLSSGPGELSRVYRTTDAGDHWRLVFTNPDAAGFFDAMAFGDGQHGMIAGDPVGGAMAIFTTADGGETWSRAAGPAAVAGEGAFAASNSCLAVRGNGVWLGTSKRVLHSSDAGGHWVGVEAPVRRDSESAGVFSLAFGEGGVGVAVGGDYRVPGAAVGNAAVSVDGGVSWLGVARSQGPHGYRSAVGWVRGRKWWIAVGTSGSDVSVDGGRTWRLFDGGGYNAVGVGPGGEVWAVGPAGRIGRLGK